ncbi:EboA domain-containing protein [Streptomyces sp. NPDC058662]|uniref:EboA domain-containing protein n=1 Tax=Streptomyces sp. NPDC058662 TaxID=3346583 RepID=UPI00365E1514
MTPAPASGALPDPRTVLDAQLAETARGWLADALAEASRAADTPPDGPSSPAAAWELRFAAAGRHCGHEHAGIVRSLLLIEARPAPDALARLYHQGSAAERRAVLAALPHLVTGPDALPLVHDALRTNDTRLVAAAVGPYAAAHLDQHSWRHAVLKCLFTQVSLDAVAGLRRRARGDTALARMLVDHAAERAAAGRDIPHDLDRVLTLVRAHPQPQES